LDVLRSYNLLIVDSRCEEFLEVYLAVAVQVAVAQNVLPLVSESDDAAEFLLGKDEFLLGDVTISIYV
jgi:hypothetical protein